MDSQSWQKVAHWRRELQTTPVFFPQEPHKQYEKAEKYDTGRWIPQVMLLQHATEKMWRVTTNTSRKNEEAGLNWKWHPAVNVSGGESKGWCFKEQYCIGI